MVMSITELKSKLEACLHIAQGKFSSCEKGHPEWSEAYREIEQLRLNYELVMEELLEFKRVIKCLNMTLVYKHCCECPASHISSKDISCGHQEYKTISTELNTPPPSWCIFKKLREQEEKRVDKWFKECERLKEINNENVEEIYSLREQLKKEKQKK